MALRSKYLFIASMDVNLEKEALFNEVYDTEHCPLLAKVPGMISVTRYETHELTMIMGGETRTIVVENEPKYHALYELESPEVLTSQAWAQAGNAKPRGITPMTRCERSSRVTIRPTAELSEPKKRCHIEWLTTASRSPPDVSSSTKERPRRAGTPSTREIEGCTSATTTSWGSSSEQTDLRVP